LGCHVRPEAIPPWGGAQSAADGGARSVTDDLVLARDAVLARVGAAPEIGVVLGSGLGGFASALAGAVLVPYDEIPGFPSTRVSGHSGELVSGTVGGARVACLSGRVHLYEGHAPSRVVFGVRLLAALGCRAVFLTNAAGGIRADLAPGSLVLINDHLNLTGQSPLVGPEEPPFPRFPDMTETYDRELLALGRDAARELGISVGEGVYAGLLGPAYETPAEIRMLSTLGAHLVGMSTVHEAIALRHRGIRVGALSIVTNLAAGLGERPLDHAEVQAAGAAARQKVESLLTLWITKARGALGFGQ
ncbi:MAG TPA: purine-nucleoside phosphorylase, partial [Polyangiaceae bacterium]|nr:purine-nucleoside phosphorylase [Polyangiaceae bacterium]